MSLFDKVKQSLFGKNDPYPTINWQLFRNVIPEAVNFLQNCNAPQEVLEILQRSVESGHKPDFVSLVESCKYGMPYFAECEDELRRLTDRQKPVLRYSIPGILDLMFYYKHTCKNKEKHDYWYNEIKEMAELENEHAMACVLSGYGQGVFYPEQIAYFEQKYKDRLLTAAASGEPWARMAVARWMNPDTFEAVEIMKEVAAEVEYSDNCVFIADYLNMNFGIKYNFEGDYSSQEWADIKAEMAKYYLLGAQQDNGPTAGYCQAYAASLYENGESGFPKDMEKAIYWYKKAAENEDELAIIHLKSLGML